MITKYVYGNGYLVGALIMSLGKVEVKVKGTCTRGLKQGASNSVETIPTNRWSGSTSMTEIFVLDFVNNNGTTIC